MNSFSSALLQNGANRKLVIQQANAVITAASTDCFDETSIKRMWPALFFGICAISTIVGFLTANFV